MLNDLENYYFSLPEPDKSTMLYLRSFILNYSENFTEHFKFKIPFFYYKGKWCCYLSTEKKTKNIYIGFINGSKMKNKKLVAGKRTMIKILYVDKEKDIDQKLLKALLKETTQLMK
jgi:hypothetical protein